MTPFSEELALAASPGVVFATYRDRLAELPAHLENVERIEVLERRELAGGVVRLRSRWHGTAKGQVPLLARPFVSPEYLVWEDTAEWDPAGLTCRWSFAFPALGSAVRCEGMNTYAEAPGGGCALVLAGALHVDLAAVPRVPRVACGLGPTVERMALARVRPNLRRVAAAVAALAGLG
jgi:hypothetical protein